MKFGFGMKMDSQDKLSFIDAVGVLSATAIGGGILALPIALYPFGVLGSALFLTFVAFINLFGGVLLAEALMRTDHKIHLPSLMHHYFGRSGYVAVCISIMLHLYCALAAYIVAGGALVSSLSGGAVAQEVGAIVYFVIASAIVLGGTKYVKGAEKIFATIVVLLALIISIFAFSNFTSQKSPSAHWLAALPAAFSVSLFAFLAHEIAPSVRIRMGDNWKGFLLALFFGTFIPAILYICWTSAIIGAVPDGMLAEAGATGAPATVPLAAVAGTVVLLLGSVFALFSTGSSYIGSAFALTDVFSDLSGEISKRMDARKAVALTVLPPVVIALFLPNSFVGLLEAAGIFGGCVLIGLMTPLVFLASRKYGKRKPEFAVPFPLGEFLAACLVASALVMLLWEFFKLIGG